MPQNSGGAPQFLESILSPDERIAGADAFDKGTACSLAGNIFQDVPALVAASSLA